MIDCFGDNGYGASCDICNEHIASCEEVHLLKSFLCANCEKAVKAACDQVKYLEKLKNAKNKM